MQIKGVAYRPNIGTDGGGQFRDVDGEFDVHDLMVPQAFTMLWRKNGTIFRFLSMRMLGLKLIPVGGTIGGWRGFVHAI